jgi:hypothetical protein
MAPKSEKDTYKKNTRGLTSVQTAAIAGNVVVGPAMRKAGTKIDRRSDLSADV